MRNTPKDFSELRVLSVVKCLLKHAINAHYSSFIKRLRIITIITIALGCFLPTERIPKMLLVVAMLSKLAFLGRIITTEAWFLHNK